MYCIPFNQLRNTDVPFVGGKNASLGEMIQTLEPFGIAIPEGFALSADAFRLFLSENNLNQKLNQALSELDNLNLENLSIIGAKCRKIYLLAIYQNR